MIPKSVIGQLLYREFVAGFWTTRWTDVFVNNPNPAEQTKSINQQFGPPLVVSVNVNSDANGWIQEPWLDEFFDTGRGRFVPGGLLASLDTTKLTNEVFDLTVAAPPLPLLAGDPVPPLRNRPAGVPDQFQARKVINGLAAVGANSLCPRLRSAIQPTLTIGIGLGGSPLPPTKVFGHVLTRQLKAGGAIRLRRNSMPCYGIPSVSGDLDVPSVRSLPAAVNPASGRMANRFPPRGRLSRQWTDLRLYPGSKAPN
jgi:hypothetical protein